MAEDEIVVIAKNAHEMQAAQATLVRWVDARIAEVMVEQTELQENHDHAVKHKWKAGGFKSALLRTRKRIEFYGKLKAALEAGYVIVPNMPLDIFAIRTNRERPLRKDADRHWNTTHTQQSEAPALAEGEYKSPVPEVTHDQWTDGKDAANKDIVKHNYWADAFNDVDFPMKTVKPHIMDETGKAMALKCFDELGIAPSRRLSRFDMPDRGKDPMVIGQVVYKAGGPQQKRVSFLVAWWLSEKDLEV